MSDHTRPPGELENRIAETRSRIDATLTAIEARLTTGHIAEQTLDYLRQSGAREFGANLAGSVKHNPLPVSLVAIGLAWLMTTVERSGHGASTRSGAAESVDHVRGELREKVADVKARASAAQRKIVDAGHAARDGAERIRVGAERLGERARDQWDSARGTYDTLMREQPLALGAIAFGIGAAVAAFLPRTLAEDELMGEASDRVKEETTSIAKDQVETVKRAGAAAAQAAAAEVDSEPAIHNEPARDLGRMQGSKPGASYAGGSAAETQPAVAESRVPAASPERR
jgi:hypothetical protein